MPYDIHNMVIVDQAKAPMVGHELPYIRQWAREHKASKRCSYKGMYMWYCSMWASLCMKDIIFQP